MNGRTKCAIAVAIVLLVFGVNQRTHVYKLHEATTEEKCNCELPQENNEITYENEESQGPAEEPWGNTKRAWERSSENFKSAYDEFKETDAYQKGETIITEIGDNIKGFIERHK